jgi:CHAT domain-containing protein
LHFAAHAVAHRESPLDSAIILAGPADSRKLYARDILAQPLTADLVTLSACETAGSRTYYGEGLLGFSWAFLSAGARNVVAGLWPVDDRATAHLMERFYQAIDAGRPPAAALRQAKLDLMASGATYRKPRYWAAFETFTRVLYR